MNAAALVTSLKQAGVMIAVENGRLKIGAPKGTLTNDLTAQIKRNRTAIIALLSAPVPAPVPVQETAAAGPVPPAPEPSPAAPPKANPATDRVNKWAPAFSRYPWPEALAARVTKLVADDLPAEPFTLRPGITVHNRALWLQRIHEAISEGPRGQRALTGALQEDLENLARLMGWKEEEE